MEKFGLTSKQSFDFLAKGFQSGLDSSGDFLDTVGEYSNLMAESGASATEFFSLMESGLQGGNLGVDKSVDLFKEFQIRFLEGGDDMLASIQELTGDGWGMFVDEIKSGDETVAGVFELMTQKIGEIEDPIARNRIGVGLMGTQFEDLGASAVSNLDLSKTKMEDLTGAAEKAATVGVSLGEQCENGMRGLLVGLQPVAEIFMPLLADGIKTVGDFFIEAKPVFDEFAENLSTTIGPAMFLISYAVIRIAKKIGLVDENAEGLGAGLTLLEGGLDIVVTGLEAIALLAQGVAFTVEQIRNLNEALGGFESFGNVLGAITGVGGISKGAGLLGLPGFADGGMVGGPGPIGSPQLIVAHKGEEISPVGGNTSLTVNVGGPGLEQLAAIVQRKIEEALQEYTDSIIGPALGA